MSDFIVAFVENRDFSTGFDTETTWRILARRGLTLLLSASDCIVASVDSREFPKEIQISKELDAFWPKAAWLSYFLWVIVLWLQLRIESSQRKFIHRRNLTHSGPKQLGSPTFCEWLYCGFSWESRVPKGHSDTEGTWRIMVRSSLALLLSTIDWIVASVENREFQSKFRYRRNLTHFGPKRLGSPTFYVRL